MANTTSSPKNARLPHGTKRSAESSDGVSIGLVGSIRTSFPAKVRNIFQIKVKYDRCGESEIGVWGVPLASLEIGYAPLRGNGMQAGRADSIVCPSSHLANGETAPSRLTLPHLHQNSLSTRVLCQQLFLTPKTQSKAVGNPLLYQSEPKTL